MNQHSEHLSETTKAITDLLADRLGPDGTAHDVAVIFCTLGTIYLGQLEIGYALNILMELGNYLIACSEKPDQMEIN